MHNKFKVTIVILISLTFIFLATQILEANSANTKSLTLMEAYKLSFEEANKWNSKSKLYFMTSTDSFETDREIHDVSGKRRNWNLMYVVPDTNKWLIIEIRDGQIWHSKEVNQFNAPTSKLIDFNETLIDSPQALKNAIDYFNLKPGEQWAKGYHFVLDKKDNEPILTVVGLDGDGYFSKVFLNGTNGEISSAIHKLPFDGGFYELNSQTALTGDKPYAILGGNISPKFIHDQSIIIWGYSEQSSIYSLPIVKVTNDAGANWKEINIMQKVNNIFFSDTYKEDNTIYFVSQNAVLKSKGSLNIFEDFFNTSDSIIDVDKYQEKFCILTENKLYYSDDCGRSWITFDIPQNSRAVKLNYKNEIYISTNKNFYKKDENTWTKINVPFENNILGFEIQNDIQILYTNESIGILDNKTDSWKIIKQDKAISKIILDFNFVKNHQIYILSEDGSITKLGGGENEWKGIQIDGPNQGGIITDIISGPYKGLYLCKTPYLQWEELKWREK